LTSELRRKIENKLRREQEDIRYKAFIAELRRKYFVRQYF